MSADRYCAAHWVKSFLCCRNTRTTSVYPQRRPKLGKLAKLVVLRIVQFYGTWSFLVSTALQYCTVLYSKKSQPGHRQTESTVSDRQILYRMCAATVGCGCGALRRGRGERKTTYSRSLHFLRILLGIQKGMSDEEGEAALFVASLSSSQIGELRALDPKALHQRLIVAGVESEGARNRIQSYVYAGAAAPTRLRFQEETALGSHAAMDLLNSAPKRGYAAIAILKCPDGQYVWQRKTRGYPIPSQVGGLCLFGGNKEESDGTARDTIMRELKEELGEFATSALHPFSRFVVNCSADVMTPREAYCFTACVFVANLPKTPKFAEEGMIELHTLDSLRKEKFCFGYNNVFNAWLVDLEGKDPSQATVGAEAPKAVGLPYVCEVSRIAPDADVGIWAGVEKWR